ncbi:MAG: PKD domain-containing protein [Flavobacteriales bacterium]
MSEERNEDEKKRAAGGSFEQGVKSAIEKAPGMVVPSWATMQTAMAGGAAGGAAAASWRWIIGPTAAAALLGGAFLFVDPDESEVLPEAEEVVSIEVGSPETMNADNVADFEAESAASDAAASALADSESAGATDVPLSESGASATIEGQGAAPARAASTDAASSNPPHSTAKPIEVPEDWAELPAEKAAAFGVDIDKACVGTEIGFRMARLLKDVRVLWNFGDGQFSSESEPHHTFNAPGTYDITLSVTRISDGLIRTRTIENLVTIHPNPEADFTWDVPNTASLDPTVALRDRSRDAASVLWVMDGERTLEGGSVDFNFPRVGEHRVQLVASSPNGCQSVADHVLEVGGRFGLGGSARFSPDGDGRYDTFLPRKLLTEERPFVFRIEDGTGHIVFETTVPKAWDGSLPGEDRARPGQTFAWTAVIQGDVGPSYFSDEVVVE